MPDGWDDDADDTIDLWPTPLVLAVAMIDMPPSDD